ncbi:PAP-associated domain-containing protein [Abeliophyllum distichum]|uniref:PAP-associated domain-containing protein n=1 Tax=Abeliophyllum distichum TaxID=126358 RepID=A0ABD1PSC4_9LAMI
MLDLFLHGFHNVDKCKGLVPNKSILGTIIRPDAILLEWKRGSNGEVTFPKLASRCWRANAATISNQHEIYFNWQLNDDDEESLPHRDGISKDGNVQSLRKRRRGSKVNMFAKM